MSSSLSSYDRLCMNEIEKDAECDPEIQKRDRLATRGTSRRKMEAGAHTAHFWEPCHQTGYDRNHHSTKMLIYFRYVHIIEDLSQNDQSPQMCGIAQR